MEWISVSHGIGVVQRVYIRVPRGRVLIGPWTHWRTTVGWGRQWTTTLRGHGRGRNSCQRLSYDFVIVSPRGALDHDRHVNYGSRALSLIFISFQRVLEEFTSRTIRFSPVSYSKHFKHVGLVCIIFYFGNSLPDLEHSCISRFTYETN